MAPKIAHGAGEEPITVPDGEPAGSRAADGVVDRGETTVARVARYARTTKQHTDDWRLRATEQIARLESERDRRALYDVVFGVRDEDDRIAGRELAAAVAYRLFFLLLPMVLIIVGGLGLASSSSEQAAADAVRESGASAAIARNIATATSELSLFEHVVVLGIGIFGTYFAGRGLLKTLSRVSAAAWAVPIRRVDRPLRVLGVVLGLVLVLVLLASSWNQLRTQLGTLEFLLALPVAGILYAIVLTVLFAQLPRPDDVDWRELIPGMLGIGLTVASMQAIVLGYIAHRISSSNELYGGIGTAIALLVWLYLLGRLFVLGPVLDAVLWRRTDASRAPARRPSATKRR